jgi:alcohol dehydrogenase (cytochrome c)
MKPVRVVPFVDRIDWGEVDDKGNVTPLRYPDKEGDPVHFWPGTGRRQGVDARSL